jgi:hypothetical protein
VKIITERMLIRALPKKWRGVYGNGRYGEDKLETLKRLDAMNVETATRQDVFKIIGNYSWTEQQCDECNRTKRVIVQLGDEPDYESTTLRLCMPCCKKALELLCSVKKGE